jgi:uncharacterized protein YacL
MCPVCVVAVGVGLGLSRWLKIDDAISGLWIGAFILSLSFVLAKWTRKSVILYFLFFLLTTIVPLWYYKIIGNPYNTLFGIDKLLFGIASGIILFSCSVLVHTSLKRTYFPFQKVVIPVVTLTLASLILYWRIYAGS